MHPRAFPASLTSTRSTTVPLTPLHPLLTRCDDKTSPDTVQCPSGTKLLPVAPLAASRFYVRGVFIENT